MDNVIDFSKLDKPFINRTNFKQKVLSNVLTNKKLEIIFVYSIGNVYGDWTREIKRHMVTNFPNGINLEGAKERIPLPGTKLATVVASKPPYFAPLTLGVKLPQGVQAACHHCVYIFMDS